MIPEVELLSGSKPAILDKYRAKFVVIEAEGKYYVCANDTVQWHNEVFESFLHRAKEQGVEVPENVFKPVGGGKIELISGKLRVYGSSEGYGRFDTEIVHPILKRFAESHDIEEVIIE